jgi:hypothetical protein
MRQDEISDEELSRMKARLAATTPPPWSAFVEGRDHECGDSFIATGGQDLYLSAEDYAGGGGHLRADLDFVAHARRDMPRLIEELERLRRIIAGR